MPQPFQNAIITNAGAKLLTRAQAGEIKIEFTRIGIGDGIYTDAEKEVSALQAMFTLKSEKNSYPLSNIVIHTNHSVKVTTLITNQDPVTKETLIDSGYFINEMGLFAKVKDEDDNPEILYSIAVTAGENGDFMPPYNGYNPAQIVQEYYVTVNNSAEVTVQGGLGAPALADVLLKLRDQKADDVQSFTQAKGRENIESGERMGTILGKVRKFFADLKPVAFSGSYTDLSDKPAIPSKASDIGAASMEELSSAIGTKVDKVSGKGLSTNDYTTAEKDKLAGIAANANNYSLPAASASARGGVKTGYAQNGKNYPVQLSNEQMFVNVPWTDTQTITGVKGNAESSYRTGNVNITPANIGLGNVNNTADANKSVSYATSAGKATNDGSGNSIVSTYAKKSIYGDAAISMGRKSGTTEGEKSSAIGSVVEASGKYSHAEGSDTTASREDAHAEGYNTTASGIASHAEGSSTKASEYCSHAEGSNTKASGNHSHAEGSWTTASGSNSHAEGSDTTASGSNSHAEGYETTASNFSSHASGKYNKAMAEGGDYDTQVGDLFVIGNGTANTAKSNALRVTYKGDIYGTKAFQSSGADYAEFIKPWADGNPDGEDRIGYFVTVRNGFLEKAKEGDYIAGITSGNPSIVGNADEDYYWRYERDEFNRIVMEDVPETIQQTDEDGKLVFDEDTHEPVMVETGKIIKNARMKLSEGYDSSLQEGYIERKDRKEWDYVGMLGVLPVRDDGTCLPDHFCKCGDDGTATLAAERGFDTYRVLERVSENVVSVILR